MKITKLLRSFTFFFFVFESVMMLCYVTGMSDKKEDKRVQLYIERGLDLVEPL